VSDPRPRRPFWRRLVPLVVGLVAVNGVVFAAYSLPRAYQVRNVTARAAEARQELAREREAAAALRESADTMRANARDAERFYRDVVASQRPDLISLLEEVEKMATEPGLKPGVRSYRLEGVKEASLTRVSVTLPLEGTYGQLVAFLDRVERSKHFVTVDRIGLTSGLPGGVVTLRVELSAYLRGKPPKEGRRG
jgi:Tfp pilus assembly protein PilO